MLKKVEPSNILSLIILAIVFAGAIYLGILLQTSTDATGAATAEAIAACSLCTSNLFAVSMTLLAIVLSVTGIIYLELSKKFSK